MPVPKGYLGMEEQEHLPSLVGAPQAAAAAAGYLGMDDKSERSSASQGSREERPASRRLSVSRRKDGEVWQLEL